MATRSPTRIRRLGAFLVAALLAMWLALLIAGYTGGTGAIFGYEPAPERIAAIVTLVEDTPLDQRETLLAALETPAFSLTLLPEGTLQAGAPARTDETLMRRYTGALAGHPFTATRQPGAARPDDPIHLNWQRRKLLTLQIGLTSGERLVIEAASPTIVTGLGTPVGLMAGAVGTLISLVALWTLWRETRPLAELARATERIDLSGAPVPLPETRRQSHEIRALARALSQLQTRLAAVLQARMALIGGISHDVRTFTTRLRLRVESIPDPDQRDRAIADIESMTRLLDDALLAARGSSGEDLRELVDMTELVRSEAAELAGRGMAVSLLPGTPEQGLYVLGDPLALRRILLNLTENAVRYGAAARIGLEGTADSVLVRIEDDGPGIPPEAREALQEPFTRGEGSRNRATGGAGLGLAVARSLIEAHGGRLSLDPQANRGATVALTLPRFTEV